MEKYIEQLLADLKAAQKNVPPDPKPGSEKTQEEFNEKMWAIENTPERPAKELFGLSFEELPPVEKLTEKQMQNLYDGIEETFEAFQCVFEFPHGVPLNIRYKFVRKLFAEKIHLMPGFTSHFNFCETDCEDCELAEYCEIKEDVMGSYDEMINMKFDENELPF